MGCSGSTEVKSKEPSSWRCDVATAAGLSDQTCVSLRRVFDAMDADQNEMIQQDEYLCHLLAQMRSSSQAAAEARLKFQAKGLSGDHKQMSYNDFVRGTIDVQRMIIKATKKEPSELDACIRKQATTILAGMTTLARARALKTKLKLNDKTFQLLYNAFVMLDSDADGSMLPEEYANYLLRAYKEEKVDGSESKQQTLTKAQATAQSKLFFCKDADKDMHFDEFVQHTVELQQMLLGFKSGSDGGDINASLQPRLKEMIADGI
jgi:Ca2+-binding EF-hand superfamily protein